MKVGVVGLGVMGKLHCRIYSELGVLSGVFDVNSTASSQVAQQYGVKSFSNLDEFFADGFDAVSIVVPTPFHKDCAIKALAAGCHILVEKPLSDNIVDAQSIIDSASSANKILAVGYIERFNPAFKALQTLVAEGVFGDITSVNVKRVGGLPRSADNIILDLMTHDFNLLTALFKKQPQSVYTHCRKNNLITDSAQVLLDFGDASATCEANWISPIKIRNIQLTGTKGYCEVDMINKEICRYDGGIFDQSPESYKAHAAKSVYSKKMDFLRFSQEPLKEELSGFLKTVQTGDLSSIVTGEDALATLELTLRAAGK
jgi:predicted dehydrogenase